MQLDYEGRPDIDLNTYLHSTIPKPCAGRPFVCDGRPEACIAIVIGENPVTKMKNDWWSFWNDDRGFDLQKFEQEYVQARGKLRISNTRRRLNRLRSKGIRCLETNAFSNEGLGGRGPNGEANDLLPLFLESLPYLRAVIAHGSVAVAQVENIPLPREVRLYKMRHFRSESYTNIDEVVSQLI